MTVAAGSSASSESRGNAPEASGAHQPRRSGGDAGPWWRGAVIYQIYPRSFADTDGDGVGDLAGCRRHLDYVASLGVDAIWLSPFFTSPMRDYGYDVSDYCAVDPRFGTLEDFDALVADAHRLGLRVIIDQVYAHTSDEHPWFVQSRADADNARADWYVWCDPQADGTPPNNWQSVFGGPAWTWDARRRQYYLHHFLASQPALNLHLPAVQEAVLEVARFWLARGVDGFRLDALNFAMHDPQLRDDPALDAAQRARATRPFDFQRHRFSMSHQDIPRFLERIRETTDRFGDRFTVAEVVGPEALGEMHSFTAGDRRIDSAYGFDFLYADVLTAALVRDTLAGWPGAPGEGWPSFAFSNHDAPRVVSRWCPPAVDSTHFARLLLLLLCSLRGNAFIYQGEELGLPAARVPFERLRDPEAIANWPRTLGRDSARTPMPWRHDAPNLGFGAGDPWLPADPAHAAHAVDLQEQDAGSVLQFTRRLLALRRRVPALRTGALRVIDGGEGELLAFERGDGEEGRVVCCFNLSHAALPLALPDLRECRVLAHVAEGDWQVSDGNSGPLPARLAPWSGVLARRSDR